MKKQRVHEICFLDAENDWDSALPVGNGKMGAMVFYKNRQIHIAVNHYDCYYRGLSGEQRFKDPARFTETYDALCKKADAVRAADGAERSHYARTLQPSSRTARPSYLGASYPQGGELLLELDERVDWGKFCLKLRIEEAEITFEAGCGGEKAGAKIWAARETDGVMIHVSQSVSGLWKSISLVIPAGTGMEPCRSVYAAKDGKLCLRTVYGSVEKDSGTSFSQELACVLTGYDGRSQGRETECCIEGIEPNEPAGMELTAAGECITAALSLQPGTGRALELAELLVRKAEREKLLHREYWKRFWTAKVSLPDPFLERLWYLHLYLMECSCGRGSSYPEQACGLSGLWDIRRPNMWGSMWYWDVNIQSAFWGCGCAGHPELWKQFCDGYLSYEEDIRAYTRQVYGIEGWALDYPHPLYHCIQPWCAQFLWEYYQFSGDTEFLEKKAYPVFREQLEFFRRLAVRDEAGVFHVPYDISPEQGPVTRDSVITISCIRRLAKTAIEAGTILKRPDEELSPMKEILEHLPEYPVTGDGRRYKDSLLAPEELYLRHPSLLMPLFPAGDALEEITPEELKRWERTLSYAAAHTETGTFGMGWLAAAAAALGRGKTALRLLYENGLDHVLHENGLAYEESERFLNYCHLTKPAHFLPVMMEASGGVVNAVNLMLLQRRADGVIRIFPALQEEKEDLIGKVSQYREDDHEVEGRYGSWDDAAFEGLITAGGFRVSAARRGGVTVFLKIECSRDGALKLALPGDLSESGCPSVLERQVKAGEVYRWGTDCEGTDADDSEPPKVLCHTAAKTRRRVYLGADRHTAYHKAVDQFTCGYLFGNEMKYPRTPYIFDFGTGEGDKDYDDSYPPQILMSGGCILYAAGPRNIGIKKYTQEDGYGFRYTNGLKAADRGAPDALRRDFLEGTGEAVFMLRLPKGRYDLLAVCGDEKEASYTKIFLPEQGAMVSTGKLSAEVFGCRQLPVVMEEDGLLSVGIVSEEGYKWKLNALFINKC